MRLDRLQHAFADYLLSGAEKIRQSVRPSSKADIDTLLSVYGHAYSARLVEVLGNDFPGLRALAGADAFDRLARAYMVTHPSRGFSVRSLGRSLAEFLAGTPPYAARPALADMASFEWAMAHAFDAADAEPIRIEHMAAVPALAWPSLTVEFHPSVRRISLRTRPPLPGLHRTAEKRPPSLLNISVIGSSGDRISMSNSGRSTRMNPRRWPPQSRGEISPLFARTWPNRVRKVRPPSARPV